MVTASACICNKAEAQLTGIAINDDGSKADTSAILDLSLNVTSPKRGFLLPRMTTAQRDAIYRPAKALLIYVTNVDSLEINIGTPSNPIWLPLPGTQNDDWHTTGNSGTNSGANFLGTTDNASLSLRTNSTERVFIDSLGFVGIGSRNFDPINPGRLLVDYGTTTSNTIANFKGSIDSYLQVNVKNSSSGTNASSDIVATADNGTDTTFYIDMGINGSNYSPSTENFGGPNDGYLYTYAKNLLIGTGKASTDIIFLLGGGVTKTNTALRIAAPSANIIIGKGENTNAPVGNILRGPNAGGSNVSGGSLTIQGGSASGTGTGGDININGGNSVSGTTGRVNVNPNSNFATNINTGTSTSDVTIGGSNNNILLPKFTSVGNFIYTAANTGQIGSTSLLTWDNSNTRLGIGTSSPQYSLEIQSASNPLYLTGVQTGCFCDSILTINNGVVQKVSPNIMAWGLTGNSGTSAATNFLGTTDAASLVIKTNSTERMRVLSSGNIGIGTTAPGSRLDVKGTLRLSGSASGFVGLQPAAVAGSTTYILPNADGTSGQQLTTDGAGNLSWTNQTGTTTNTLSLSNDTLYSTVNGVVATSLAVNGVSNTSTGNTLTTTVNGVTGGGVNIINSNALSLSGTTLTSTVNGVASAGLDISSAINSKAWLLTGNSNATSSNFLGTINKIPLSLRTWNTQRMMITENGNFGLLDGVSTSSFNSTNPEKVLIDAGNTSSYNLIQARGSINSYLQFNIQNQSSTGQASTDIVASADNATESTGFIDMGINSSNYNSSTGITGFPLTAYIYSTGNDFTIGNATAGKSLTFFTGGFVTGVEAMRIDGSQNVGIGTTSPGSKLDVKGTLRLSGSTSGYVGFQPAAVAGSTTYTLPSADGTAGQQLTTNGAGVLNWTNQTGTTTVSNTSSTNTLTTTVNGVTGTGVNIINSNALSLSSGDILTSTVNGVASTGLDLTPAITANAWSLTGNGGTSAATNFIGTTDVTDFVTKTSNTERMRILSSGNVGIGTSSPAELLHVYGGSAVNAGLKISSNLGNTNNILKVVDNKGLQIQNNAGTAIMAFDNTNQRVGIGTTSPSYKLQVFATADPLFLTGVQTGSISSDSVLTISNGVVKKIAPLGNIVGLYKNQYSVNLPAIANNDGTTVTVSVANAPFVSGGPNPVVQVNPTVDLPDGLIIAWCRVSATNTVKISLRNVSNQSTTAQTVKFDVSILQ